MGNMKSAFERAWERAERLGKLSPQELRERKEEEFSLIGYGLAERYLEHGRPEILEEEVSKYSDEEKEIVTRATLSRLVAAMEIEGRETATRAMTGIVTLKGNGPIQGIGEKIASIYQEYEQERQQKYEQKKDEIQRGEREILHRLRISGSAVAGIDSEVSATWHKMAAGLRSQFNERLDQLKQELLNLLTGG